MGIKLLLIYMCTIYLGFCHVITEEDYALLPPLYEMDNYTNCKLQKNAYCQVSFTLKPLQNSKTWELIQISKKEKFMFSREVIHRAVCIPRDYEGFEDWKAFVESKINEKLKPLYLSTKADDIVCSVKPSFNLPPSSIGILLYILFVVIATMVDHNYKMSSNDIIGKVTKHFSLARNFRKIFRTPSTSDYQRLKCIQGIRTLTCTGIIVIHSKVSHFLTNHEVKREFEELYSIHYYLFIFDYFVIQIFLIISPWLLTVAVLNLYERNGHFTAKDAIVMFVNRCFRFWPVLIAIVFVLRNSNNFNQVSDATAPKLLAISASACRNNWMATTFFYQNFYLIEDTCANGTWYVSADVQLYALSLIILFLTLKTKSTAILKISLILSYVVFACVIYFNDLDVVFRPYPGFFQTENMGRLSEPLYLYLMTYVHAPTYFLGICFGIYYHRQKTEKTQVTKMFVIFWIISFVCLPILVVVVASKEWKGLPAAIIGPLLKPLFAFGFAIGILGVSKSIGGVLKKFLECRPLEVLSNITYSTYIFHFIAVFERSLTTKKLLKLDSYTLIRDAIVDIPLSLLIGLFAYMFIEIPWANLQREYIPNAKKQDGDMKKRLS